MRFLPNKLVAGAGIAALSAVGLFAVGPQVQRRAMRSSPAFVSEIENVLAMNTGQRQATEAAFSQARQQAEPIHQQLDNTRSALESAIKSGNGPQIQQLASTEGSEIGQLITIRSQAMARVYKTLSPQQQQTATSLEKLLVPESREHMSRERAAS